MNVRLLTRALRDALALAAPVVPAKSANPVHADVLLCVEEDEGCSLSAVSPDLAIRVPVLGAEPSGKVAFLLPPVRLGQILGLARDETLDIAVTKPTKARDSVVEVLGLNTRFEFGLKDASLFPPVPPFAGEDYHTVPPVDLERLVERTVFATNVRSTQYALGGALLEADGDTVALVATDGRRVARMTAQAVKEGKGAMGGNGRMAPVVPRRALKALARLARGTEPPVRISGHSGAITNGVCFRTGHGDLHARLLEGRFPRYQDIFDTVKAKHSATVAASALRAAVEQSVITTSDESRGVDFAFGGDIAVLFSTAADVGQSKVELPLAFHGAAITLTLDVRYLLDMLRALPPEEEVRLEISGPKTAVVFRAEGYHYAVQPLVRE
jgi:DNA polymerase III subunit beta